VQRVEQEREQWEKKYEVRKPYRQDRQVDAHKILSVSIHRKLKRNTENPRQSWMNWLPAWKGYNRPTLISYIVDHSVLDFSLSSAQGFINC
jgi:hypothetical protein